MTGVAEAVARRRSIRAFTDEAVDVDLVARLVEQATSAPSGGNLQPWHLHLVAGETIARLRARVIERLEDAPMGDGADYAIYPEKLGEPFRARRFAVGEAMYARLGIPRDDREARRRWFARNFDFFGAPIGLFCFVRRDHGPPQWSDCGMMLQTLMLLLVENGLDSCPQEAWALMGKTVAAELGVDPDLMLFTGMAIGRRDPDAAVNALEAGRAPIAEVLTVHR